MSFSTRFGVMVTFVSSGIFTRASCLLVEVVHSPIMTESGVSTYHVYSRGTIDTVHRGGKRYRFVMRTGNFFLEINCVTILQ